MMYFIFPFLLKSKILEDMKKFDVKPKVQTYMCLLNACAATGHLDRVYASSFMLWLFLVLLIRTHSSYPDNYVFHYYYGEFDLMLLICIAMLLQVCNCP